MSTPMTPSQNWAGGVDPGRRSHGPELVVVFVVGMIGAVIGGVLTAAVIGFIALVNNEVLSSFPDSDFIEPEGIMVSWSAPTIVEIGDEFDLDLTVRNTGDIERHIVALDVEDSLLQGVDILFSEPEMLSLEPSSGPGGYAALIYNDPIAAGQTVEMTLRVRATTEGVYTGYLDVCIDERSSWKSMDVRFSIVAPDGEGVD